LSTDQSTKAAATPIARGTIPRIMTSLYHVLLANIVILLVKNEDKLIAY
jgi:hypothetical protein